MYVGLCSVLPPENWSAYLPNKGNSLLTYLLYPVSHFLTTLETASESHVKDATVLLPAISESSSAMTVAQPTAKFVKSVRCTKNP